MKIGLLIILLFGLTAIQARAQTETIGQQAVAFEIVKFDDNCGVQVFGRDGRLFTDEAGLRDRLAENERACQGAPLPTIDFARYALAGKAVTVGSCSAGQTFRVRVMRDDASRIYRHVVLEGRNPCRGLSSLTSAILIPKLPDGYNFVFADFVEESPIYKTLIAKYGRPARQSEFDAVFLVRPDLELSLFYILQKDGFETRVTLENDGNVLPSGVAGEIVETVFPLARREPQRGRKIVNAASRCYRTTAEVFDNGAIERTDGCPSKQSSLVRVQINLFDKENETKIYAN